MQHGYITQLTNDDISQLDLLALAHYIVGAVGAFLSLFSFIYVVLGIAALSGTMGGDAPLFVGWLFVFLGVGGLICGEAASICIIYSGRNLKQRKGYVFSFVVACFLCVNAPVGTILGVLTVIVLSRSTVKAAFEKG